MTPRHMLRALALLAGLAGTPAAAAELVPYEARFNLVLVGMEGAESVAGAGGELVFRVERSCTGWTVLNRMLFGAALDAERAIAIESMGGSTESFDGRTLSFEHQVSINGQSAEVTRGTATLGTGGKPSRATYTEPERKELTLPPGTVLPMTATVASLDAFAKGQKLRSYIQFDGQDPDGPVRISEVITGKPKPLATPPKGDTGLLKGPVWRVATSFFGLDAESIEPRSTMVSEIHANGVLQRLRMNISAFTVEAELIELKSLPAPSC